MNAASHPMLPLEEAPPPQYSWTRGTDKASELLAAFSGSFADTAGLPKLAMPFVSSLVSVRQPLARPSGPQPNSSKGAILYLSSSSTEHSHSWLGQGTRVARLLAVNVGLPRDITWRGTTVHTGIWKEPVEGRRMVRRLNVEGDGQGDLAGHGGEHRAVMVYQIESYRYWEGQLGRSDFTYGQFGENFTVEGLPDDEVCIGDRYRIGAALFEVTQPRVTCYRVGIRMDEPRMAALLVSHRRPGFYFRVLQAGRERRSWPGLSV